MSDDKTVQSFPQGDFVGRPEIDSKFKSLEDKFKSLEGMLLNLRSENIDNNKELRAELKEEKHFILEQLEHRSQSQEDRTTYNIERVEHLIKENRESMNTLITESAKSARWTAGFIISVAGLALVVVNVITSLIMKSMG